MKERRHLTEKVRVTPTERAALDERAHLAGMSRARFMRESSLGRFRSATDRATVHQLTKVGTNLNQLVRKVNGNTPVRQNLAQEARQVLAAVWAAIEQISVTTDDHEEDPPQG